ncbi:MAG: hypothetical protein R2813_13115 [Flavobacteriales bacterium]
MHTDNLYLTLNLQKTQRITTLWAITECGLGGFFHAIQSPFTGLLVGGLAVVYISLIALIASQGSSSALDRIKSIFTSLASALVFVLMVKAIVSPHSPIGAYFAVSLQALLGMVFFSLIPKFRLAAMFTAIGATVTSAAQKLIILVILFGTPLFEAIDSFVISTAEKLEFINAGNTFSASLWLAMAFVGIYAIGGVFIGWFTGLVPLQLKQHQDKLDAVVKGFHSVIHTFESKKKNHWIKYVFAAVIVIAFTVEYFFISSSAAWIQLIRTLTIIGLWVLAIQPLLKWFIRTKASNSSVAHQADEIQQALPTYLSFARYAWSNADSISGFKLNSFLLLLLYFSLHED